MVEGVAPQAGWAGVRAVAVLVVVAQVAVVVAMTEEEATRSGCSMSPGLGWHTVLPPQERLCSTRSQGLSSRIRNRRNTHSLHGSRGGEKAVLLQLCRPYTIPGWRLVAVEAARGVAALVREAAEMHLGCGIGHVSA